ncbi:MAG: ROK family protein, partial [Dethiobacteria bacterium]
MGDPVYAAVDLGGTKIIIMTVDRERSVKERVEFSTPPARAPALMLREIKDYIELLLGKQGKLQLASIGICCAGFVNKEGHVISSPNIPALHNFPLKIETEGMFSVPVIVENDANAAAYGEYRFGAGRGSANMLFITVSTGVGCGIILEHKIYRGSGGFAGELGHFQVAEDQTPCACGNRGCLEKLSSGEAIAWRASQEYAQQMDTADVFQAFRKGEPESKLVIDRAVDCLARGIANALNLLNPEKVIIGGGVSNEEECF